MCTTSGAGKDKDPEATSIDDRYKDALEMTGTTPASRCGKPTVFLGGRKPAVQGGSTRPLGVAAARSPLRYLTCR